SANRRASRTCAGARTAAFCCMSEAAPPAAGLPGVEASRGQTMDFAWICALYELGQSAANGADPQRVRQDILEHIVRGFDAESGSIALIAEGTEDQLELAAGTDLPPGLIG